MISTVITPQVDKISRIYPYTRKLPAGFSLWKGRSVQLIHYAARIEAFGEPHSREQTSRFRPYKV